MSSEDLRLPARPGAPQPGVNTTPLVAAALPPRRGRNIIRRVLDARLAGAGLVVLALVVFCALLAPAPPNAQDYLALTAPPGAAHLLGTDDLGRDVLSRIIYGSRVSLEVGIIAAGIALGLGNFLIDKRIQNFPNVWGSLREAEWWISQ